MKNRNIVWNKCSSKISLNSPKQSPNIEPLGKKTRNKKTFTKTEITAQ